MSDSGSIEVPLKVNMTRSWYRQIVYHRSYYLLLLPGILYFIIFHYIPMWGVSISFLDYHPIKGLSGSEWVGLKHFAVLFRSPDFWEVFRNTILISLLKIIFGFPAPIVLALLLNELGGRYFKRFIQTVAYLPHFLSWVIFGGIMVLILSPSSGIVNHIIKSLGGRPIFFLANQKWFVFVLVVSAIWKTAGWGTIIYLAKLSSIDPSLYQSAMIDGANRWQQVRYITLPCMLDLIVVMFILRVGHILDAGFQQILILYNPAVYDVADVFDTFVYRVGLTQLQYSFATAVGLFKSAVGLALVLMTNKIAKSFGDLGIW